MGVVVLPQSQAFAEAVKEAMGGLSISQAAYKTGVSYEYVRTMVTYGRVPSEAILEKFAKGLDADVHKLRVAAGYEQTSDPVERVEFALEGIDHLEDWQAEAMVRLIEQRRKHREKNGESKN